MTLAPPPVAPAPTQTRPATSLRRGALALALQEALTATVRLRANRQVAADADSFRRHIRQVLATAEQDARRAGYADEDIRLALYAAVAFLDESVLNSTQRMFAEWPRKPLQEELFGGHLGGEMFFQNLQHLLARPDSDDTADVLEVYQLCMQLGFHGRYSAAGSGELPMIMQQVAEKIRRVRGDFGELSPAWRIPPGDIPIASGDPWLKRLSWGAIGAFVLAVLIFAFALFSLRSGTADLHALAQQIVH